MASKTLFYSWQSDLNQNENNYFIRDCIKEALKVINKEIDFELSLDKDTQETSGSPDIVDTIFKKIRACDIFIADVTIINPEYSGRKIPNPNVLIELGYAIKTLGWERIICVVNTDQCRPEDLPFDIRNNRTSTYNFSKGDKKVTEEKLTATFVIAIRTIIDDFEDILERHQQTEYIDHDKRVFGKFDSICSQINLFDSLDFLGTNLMVDGTHYSLWRTVISFAGALENSFLNKEIQEDLLTLTQLLAEAKTFAAKNLFFENRPDVLWPADYEKKGTPITPEIQFEIDQSHRYSFPSFLDVRSDDIDAYKKRKYHVQDEFNRHADEVQEAYKKFRLSVKKHLFI